MQNSIPPIYELGSNFYDIVEPAKFPQQILRFRNQKAAQSIGLSNLSDSQWLEHFASFKPLGQNISHPLALRYHGHQFTHYNPELGDGRGFLFAQFLNNGKLLDLGTKGSGTTPYSRNGDGRLTLKGAVREALATATLELYGVNTSKTFSVIETGESLVRHDEPSPTRAAVLVRLSHSHIRFGTFQRYTYLNQLPELKKLISYCLQHYYPECQDADESLAAYKMFRAVVDASAKTVAQWMMAGFVHGVMNTDNMNITGESFDYGPYRFLPTYDVQFTAAYFDHQGLYCFGRQPITMHWNLEQLAKCFNKAYPESPFSEALEQFGEDFQYHAEMEFLRRLNLTPLPGVEISQLMIPFFNFAEKSKAGYEQLFFDLHSGWERQQWQNSPQKNLYEGELWSSIIDSLRSFECSDINLTQSEYYQKAIPQTLLYSEIESIWKDIAERDDWQKFYDKLNALDPK
ncbi:MAG: protein adenylyltransferase SelO family protein [Bdellovibrionia bacterium]